MPLDEIAYILAQYSPIFDQPEEVTTRLNWGQHLYYHKCISDWNTDALQPLKVIRGEHGTPPLNFVNGECLLPTDFQKEEKMYHLIDGEQCPINILDDDAFEVIKTNALEKPDIKHPIANVQSNYIRTLPKSIKFAVLSYVKAPTPVIYAVDTSKGYARYDAANSVEFEWNEFDQITIIMLVLESIGIVASREEIQNKKKQ